MAESVVLSGKGYCIELGAGTGVVTRALLDRGIPPTRLILIERSERFVEILQKKFPSVIIICGDASELGHLLNRRFETAIEIDAIVSSLPLRSMPAGIKNAIVRQWTPLLTKHSRVIQFSYFILGKSALNKHGLKTVLRRTVMRNLPPAKVNCYQIAEAKTANRS
jgi:phospholipid N-methyltransferase